MASGEINLAPGGVSNDNIRDDIIVGFQLENSGLRGRIVRLGSVLADILAAHDYPRAVSALVGETLTLTALLSSMLKYDGIFTLQAKGKGPVLLVVGDMESNGGIRACATFKEDSLETLQSMKSPSLAEIMGDGYLVFTVDQGGNTERYQGIVELKGESLRESVQHYFHQSEQIKTGIVLATGTDRAGGIILQRLPNAPSKESKEIEEDWQRAMTLMASCRDTELLDGGLHPEDLLYRLFHEEGVRVFTPMPLFKSCRCSAAKIENIFITMSEKDIDDMAVDGKISAQCEFCSTRYDFPLAEIKEKLAKKITD